MECWHYYDKLTIKGFRIEKVCIFCKRRLVFDYTKAGRFPEHVIRYIEKFIECQEK